MKSAITAKKEKKKKSHRTTSVWGTGEKKKGVVAAQKKGSRTSRGTQGKKTAKSTSGFVGKPGKILSITQRPGVEGRKCGKGTLTGRHQGKKNRKSRPDSKEER